MRAGERDPRENARENDEGPRESQPAPSPSQLPELRQLAHGFLSAVDQTIARALAPGESTKFLRSIEQEGGQ